MGEQSMSGPPDVRLTADERDSPDGREPATADRATAFVDSFGRRHTDLRVSLTDRCSLRCTYCMPAEGLPWLASASLLTTPELMRLVGIAVRRGVRRVRLTGGEPLLRPDVVEVVREVAALPEQPEVSLTTNGLRLPALAAPLRDAGLCRVNISLDTLDRRTFQLMAHRDRLVDTLAGIAAAKAAGLHPVKINTVLLRGINDHEAAGLLRWALDEGLSLRFIEQMPLDPQHGWQRANMVTGDEIRVCLRDAGFLLSPVATRGSAPAEEFLVNGGPATVGIVASVTAPFCGDCDRVRLTADGQWRSCLFARDEVDLRTALRSAASDDDLLDLMRREVQRKAAAHGIGEPDFRQPDRPMSAIGG
jgi:GTP 3',8-cyclase